MELVFNVNSAKVWTEYPDAIEDRRYPLPCLRLELRESSIPLSEEVFCMHLDQRSPADEDGVVMLLCETEASGIPGAGDDSGGVHHSEGSICFFRHITDEALVMMVTGVLLADVAFHRVDILLSFLIEH
jgi:hypothetical protein